MNSAELFQAGKYQEVLSLIGESVNADDLKLKAHSHQKLGEFEQAMDCWNQLIQKLPEVATFYNERGVCKFNLRFKHAMNDFDHAILLEPENAYFYACRAYIRDKVGNTEGSVEDYKKAHELDPENAITLNNLGLAEQKLGHTSSAREFFKKSNDLIGYQETVWEEEADTPPDTGWSARWKEVRKMLSSWTEFKKFLKELNTRQ